MPKVYIDSAERQAAKIIRTLKGAAAGRQNELADCWGVSQQAVSHRLNTGNVTMLDLWKARDIIDLDARDIEYLIRERG